MPASIKKVLVVDDAPAVRELMARMLKKIGGLEVLMASDGQEALRLLDKGPFIHLVFCDVNMPLLDGLTFVENLAERVHLGRLPNMPPVVMLTTESSMSQVLRGRAAGVLGWIIKPPREENIAQIVRKFIPAESSDKTSSDQSSSDKPDKAS